ncbi:MAG TPA: hypothetical protein VEX68_02035, partial [Bryobacteraceae bacterium]|nr:hypothetical protein [Bryobacteraceae bacterium]
YRVAGAIDGGAGTIQDIFPGFAGWGKNIIAGAPIEGSYPSGYPSGTVLNLCPGNAACTTNWDFDHPLYGRVFRNPNAGLFAVRETHAWAKRALPDGSDIGADVNQLPEIGDLRVTPTDRTVLFQWSLTSPILHIPCVVEVNDSPDFAGNYVGELSQISTYYRQDADDYAPYARHGNTRMITVGHSVPLNASTTYYYRLHCGGDTRRGEFTTDAGGQVTIPQAPTSESRPISVTSVPTTSGGQVTTPQAPTSESRPISVTTVPTTSGGQVAIPQAPTSESRPISVTTVSTTSTVASPAAEPEVLAITPLSGSGPAGKFTATFTHGGGAGQLYLGYMLFLPTSNKVSYTATGSCLVEYNRISNGMRLIDNAGTGWLGPVSGVVLGPAAGTLSNDQCTVSIAGSTVSVSGETLVVTVPVTFKNALTPVVGTFLQALDVTGKWTGMTQFGNWVLPTGKPRPGPSIVSVTNSTTTGSSAVYTATTRHTSGAGSISMIHLLVGKNIADRMPCQVVYFPGSRTLNLIDDTGSQLVSATGAPVGGEGSLANSRCSVNTRLASQTASGTTVTITIAITFQTGTFAGAKNVYVNAFGAEGELTHWVQAATLNVQ